MQEIQTFARCADDKVFRVDVKLALFIKRKACSSQGNQKFDSFIIEDMARVQAAGNLPFVLQEGEHKRTNGLQFPVYCLFCIYWLFDY